jgi:hypothetical protein
MTDELKRIWKKEVVVLSHHFPGWNEENRKNSSQDSCSQGQDLNPRPPEYEARMLTIRRQYSVYNYFEVFKKCLTA